MYISLSPCSYAPYPLKPANLNHIHIIGLQYSESARQELDIFDGILMFIRMYMHLHSHTYVSICVFMYAHIYT
jgi:hypothetical protein